MKKLELEFQVTCDTCGTIIPDYLVDILIIGQDNNDISFSCPVCRDRIKDLEREVCVLVDRLKDAEITIEAENTMKAKVKVVEQEEKGARILYKNISHDRVVILGFEGIMTANEIKEKYLRVVYDAYFKKKESMCLHRQSDDSFVLSIHNEIVKAPQVMDSKNFSALIADMKKCGKRLAEIIKANRENPIKEVRI